jgi:hypothetical protein
VVHQSVYDTAAAHYNLLSKIWAINPLVTGESAIQIGVSVR